MNLLATLWAALANVAAAMQNLAAATNRLAQTVDQADAETRQALRLPDRTGAPLHLTNGKAEETPASPSVPPAPPAPVPTETPETPAPIPLPDGRRSRAKAS